MTTQIVPYDQMEKMAVAVAKSGLFGMKTAEQALALMLLAQAEGMHPAIAARDYHVIQNRPALKADAMLARFQAAGGKVTWNAYTDQEVSATFSHPSGGAVTIAWTMAQAKAAGLAQKDVWKQYPRAMLRSRVISEGIRTVYPGVAVGVYTEEEVRDFDAKPEVQVVSTVVEAKPVASVKLEAVGQPKEPTPAEIIKKSGWSKKELSDYSHQAFGVSNSKDLDVNQLKLIAEVVSSASFDVAMKELYDSQNHDDTHL